MKVDFIRFKATDDVELQGWLNNENGDVAVVHIHGMSGNGYENYFLDDLREMYAKHCISLYLRLIPEDEVLPATLGKAMAGNTQEAALRFLRKA